MTLIFPDRVIAVRGSVENMSKAESAISALLRECLEKDVHSMVHLCSVLVAVAVQFDFQCDVFYAMLSQTAGIQSCIVVI